MFTRFSDKSLHWYILQRIGIFYTEPQDDLYQRPANVYNKICATRPRTLCMLLYYSATSSGRGTGGTAGTMHVLTQRYACACNELLAESNSTIADTKRVVSYCNKSKKCCTDRFQILLHSYLRVQLALRARAMI